MPPLQSSVDHAVHSTVQLLGTTGQGSTKSSEHGAPAPSAGTATMNSFVRLFSASHCVQSSACAPSQSRSHPSLEVSKRASPSAISQASPSPTFG